MPETRLFRLTAADFNGQSFDGSPFEFLGRYDTEARIVIPVTTDLDSDVKSLASAVESAIVKGLVSMHTKNGTDYAQWAVKYEGGVFDYGPGDYVLVMSAGMLLWVPGSVMSALGIKIPEKVQGA